MKNIFKKFETRNYSNGTCSNDDSAESGNGCGSGYHKQNTVVTQEDSQRRAAVAEDVSTAGQETVTEQSCFRARFCYGTETASEENAIEEVSTEIVGNRQRRRCVLRIISVLETKISEIQKM